MTRISAIVPVHDRPGLLPEAVESLVATGYPDLEIVIVDDGSGGETVACLLDLERRFSGLVRTVRHADGGNHGPGASRNLGVRESSGAYVCFLDSDDVVLPHRFARAVAVLDDDPSIDAVCERFLRADAASGAAPAIARDREGLRKALLGPGVRWHMGSILMRRRAFEELGGFSESLRTSEDWVLWIKLGLAGSVVDGGPEPVAIYRRHGGNTPPVLENSLLAFLEVIRWSRGRRLDAERIAAVRRGAWGKMLYVCDRARREGRPGLAARMLMAAAAADPRFALRGEFWKNLLAAGGQVGLGR